MGSAAVTEAVIGASALSSPGALLRAWRTAMGWTQGDVARAVQVTRAAVTSWEADSRRIPSRALEDLDFTWVTGGSLTGLVRAVGSPRSAGLAGPRRQWGHVFPAGPGPVWAWTRPAAGDRVTGFIRVGQRGTVFDEAAGRDGLILALPGTGSPLPLRVTLNAPGWADFGRGTIPPWLDRPVTIIGDPADAGPLPPADPAWDQPETGTRRPATAEERVALHRQLREARSMSQADAAATATVLMARGRHRGVVTRQQVRNYEEGRASRVRYLPALLDMAYGAFGWSCREPAEVTRTGTDTFEAVFPAWWAGPVSVSAVPVSAFPDPGRLRLALGDREWQCQVSAAPLAAEHVRTPAEPPLTAVVPAGWRVHACMGQTARAIDADRW